MLRCSAVAFAMLAALGSPAQAQMPLATQPIDSGTLVRIRLDSGTAIRGRLLATFVPGTSQLQLCLYPGRACTGAADPRGHTIETRVVGRLEVAAGSRWRTGAVIGAVLGIAAGGLGHGFALDSDSHSGPVPPAARFYIAGALGGAL